MGCSICSAGLFLVAYIKKHVVILSWQLMVLHVCCAWRCGGSVCTACNNPINIITSRRVSKSFCCRSCSPGTLVAHWQAAGLARPKGQPRFRSRELIQVDVCPVSCALPNLHELRVSSKLPSHQGDQPSAAIDHDNCQLVSNTQQVSF